MFEGLAVFISYRGDFVDIICRIGGVVYIIPPGANR